MSSPQIELELSNDDYVTLLDCINYTKENVATSVGRVSVAQLQNEVLKQHDEQ